MKDKYIEKVLRHGSSWVGHGSFAMKLVETYNLPNCDEVLTQSRQNIRYSIDEDNIFTQSSICSGLVKKQNSKEIKKMTENYAGDISKQSDTKISCFVQFDKQQ